MLNRSLESVILLEFEIERKNKHNLKWKIIHKGGSNKLSICVIRQKYVERLLVSTRRCYREYYTHIYRGGLLLIHTEDNCTSVASIHRSTEIHTLITFSIHKKVLLRSARGNRWRIKWDKRLGYKSLKTAALIAGTCTQNIIAYFLSFIHVNEHVEPK